MEDNNTISTPRKRKTDYEKYDDIEKKIEQLQAYKKQVAARIKAKEKKERTKRLINAGAAVEAVMKEVTGQEEYPAEGDNLEKILNILRRKNVLTVEQERYIRAGATIEALMKDISKNDSFLLEGDNLKHVQELIQKNKINSHHAMIGRIVEEATPITDLAIWAKYIDRYAEPIRKYQVGERIIM